MSEPGLKNETPTLCSVEFLHYDSCVEINLMNVWLAQYTCICLTGRG
jgi:hypothetical protein